MQIKGNSLRQMALTGLLGVCAVLGLGAVPAGFPESVKALGLKPNLKVSVAGQLETGLTISDLTWASNSAVACFPATQNSRFKARHVLFHTLQPPHSVLTLKLVPQDLSQNMSLYAYQVGTTNYPVVPQLRSAVTCEAAYKLDRPVRGKVEDGTRSIQLTATTHPYNVVIGISGDQGASGSFTLEATLQQ